MNSNMKPICEMTDKQRQCIRTLSLKTGRELPSNLEMMSKREASEHISELLEAVGNGRGPGQPRSNGNGAASSGHETAGGNGQQNTLPRDAQIRLGMAAKLVYQQWSHLHHNAFEEKEKFKENVVELYALIREVEEDITRASAST